MNVLEELTEFEDRIDRNHVERRVDDWEERLLSLYDRLTSWLPAGWRSAVGPKKPLFEPLMSRFGIPERELPQLVLYRGDREQARLEPRNLWIIGSNGRVDLIGPAGHFVLNDRSDFFEQPSWQIAALQARLQEAPLTADSFRRVL